MKLLSWLGNSKKDLLDFPEEVRQEMGYALHCAQIGKHYKKTKPFKDCGSGIYEIVIEFDKNAYRTVYIIITPADVYVIHAFQKKSKTGIKTPKEEINIIQQRLKLLKQALKDEVTYV